MRILLGILLVQFSLVLAAEDVDYFHISVDCKESLCETLDFKSKHLSKVDILLDNSKLTDYRVRVSKEALNDIQTLKSSIPEDQGLRISIAKGQSAEISFDPKLVQGVFKFSLIKAQLENGINDIQWFNHLAKKTTYTKQKQRRFEIVMSSMIITTIFFLIGIYFKKRKNA